MLLSNCWIIQSFTFFFKPTRWDCNFVKAVVFPFLYKLLVLSQPVRVGHAGGLSQNYTPSLCEMAQIGTNLFFYIFIQELISYVVDLGECEKHYCLRVSQELKHILGSSLSPTSLPP